MNLRISRVTLGILASLAVIAPRAWGKTDATCLTGNDPAVINDASQIAALRGVVEAACPCDVFDGKRRDYVRCVTREIHDAVAGGGLRARCKSRVTRAFRQSSCGRKSELHMLPCIQTSAAGKVRCRILKTEACLSKPGRYERVACSEYVNCVDAGDDNGDYIIDRFDSGACIATPTPTSSSTATPTTTPTPTATVTATDTLPPTATTTATDIPTPTATVTATVCQNSGIIIPHVDVNTDDDLQSPPLRPDPAASLCRPQTNLAGGCALNPLDGSVTNVFDARATIDQSMCPGDPPPSYHWEIFRPPGLGSSVYTSSGISGYDGPVLTILPSSLPALQGTTAGQDVFWRVGLTITSNVPGHYESTQVFFRFDYQQSVLTLTMSTDCQRIGHLQDPECTIEAINGLPANEPT